MLDLFVHARVEPQRPEQTLAEGAARDGSLRKIRSGTHEFGSPTPTLPKLLAKRTLRFETLLEDLGVRVLVVPPDPAQPGLVYPANAGWMANVDKEQLLAERRFTLSNLLPTRAGEKAHYRRILEAAFAMATLTT